MSRNLKFVFMIYAKTIASESKPDFGGDRWRSFLKFVAIRNRITHPKCIQDWNLTDAEMTEIQIALVWYMEEIWALLASQPFLEAALLKTATATWQPQKTKPKRSK